MRYFLGMSATLHVVILTAVTLPMVMPTTSPLLHISLVSRQGDSSSQQDSASTMPSPSSRQQARKQEESETPKTPTTTTIRQATTVQEAAVNNTDMTAAKNSDANSAITDSRHNSVANSGTLAARDNSIARAETLQRALLQALAPYFHYPPMARRNGWQGVVRLGMTIQPTGKLADVYVVHSSGYNMLDKAALRSVRQIRHLPDVQKKWLAGHPFDMVIPVEYRLVSR